MSKETINIQVSGMSCEHCVNAVCRAVNEISGVTSVNVSIDEGIVTVDYDMATTDAEEIKQAINDAGYETQ